MSTRSRRQRTSTSATAPPESTQATAELQVLLNALTSTLLADPTLPYPELSTLIEQAQSVRRYLIAASEGSKSKDDFRHLHGFQIVLDTLRAFSGFYHPNKRSDAQKVQLFELLEIILGILGQAFREHHGNRRYFKRRVEGGGWAALEQTIASIGLGGSESDVWGESELFGRLLAFALDDKRFEILCRSLAKSHLSLHGGEGVSSQKDGHPDKKSSEEALVGHESIKLGDDTAIVGLVQEKVQKILQENALLHIEDVIPIIIDFWKSIPRDMNGPVNPACLVVVLTLSKIATISSHNLLALHRTGIFTSILPMAFDTHTPLSKEERQAVESLCNILVTFGISNLRDAQYLVTNDSPAAAEFLLRAMKSSQSPAFVQFDLSLHGFSSIELPTLGRSFPPQSDGYTFLAWICIDRFDPNAHTTIFGAFDSTQTCFVLAYLEQDTHNLILQTSVTSSRPSVRFKSTAFKERTWYHIAIVHRRPRTLTHSKASLYVNGEFSEQVKCQYPAPPPLSNGSTDSFASFTSSSAKQNPVQAFLGTPQDLSARLGRGVVFSRWSLASAHLIEDILSDDLIAVYHRLGSRYNGNFQDCLGSFQTYEASAALGMRNQLMHPSKDADTSEISIATRDKGSKLLSESRILLSIQPSAIFGEDSRWSTHESQLLRGLNRKASNNLFQLTHNNGTSVAVNGAVPAINEALMRAQGTTVLTGEPVVVVPQSMDCALWRLAGFTGITLKMVERADTLESIVRAVEILFESIKGNWRNSEATEREHGYPILGALIRGKIGAGTVVASNSNAAELSNMSIDDRDKLSFQLLSLVLKFVGYNHEFPEESFIINPLAYRILLVDFDMWRKSAPMTQKLYYKQFIVFGVNSKHHHINGRRLYHMRIVKRFLDAMKSETFSREIFPFFLEALETLVKCNMTAEVFRSLALFVTYAFHTPSASGTMRGVTPSRSNTVSSGPRRPNIMTVLDGKDFSSILARRELGTKVLEMYAGLLCQKGSSSNIQRFAKTVTNKWLLYLLTEDDPAVVVHGCRILARLLVVHGSVYTGRFASKSGGFIILRNRLRKWWDVPALWPICFSILFAYDVADIDFEKSFELFSLFEIFHDCKVVNSGMLPVITAMLQNGLRDVLRNQEDVESPLSARASSQNQQQSLDVPATSTRRMSMSLTKELEAHQEPQRNKDRVGGQATVLHTVIRFFADLHSKSPVFRDFAVNSDYVRYLLAVLFPVVVSTDTVNPEIELNSRDSTLTFEGDDVIIRPISRVATLPAPIVRTSTVETELPPSPTTPRAKPLRRGSAFILLTSRPSEFSPSSARLNLVMSPKKKVKAQPVSNGVVEGLLELVVSIFVDQVMARKEFPGFSLSVKIPPGFQEHQAYFESYLLRNTISQLSTTVQLDQKSLWEPRLIQNMARFALHIGEAVFEGWFLGGAEPLLDFAGTLLEYLQRPEVSTIKTVRLCNQAVLMIKSVFLRVVLLRLSELDSAQASEEEALSFMDKLLYWQTVVLSSEVGEDDHLKLICYQLYIKLVDTRRSIRLAAANLWRILLVQKPEETSTMLQQSMTNEQQDLTSGFQRLTELDNETFVEWVDCHRGELDALFFGAMSKIWEDFVNAENSKTEEAAKSRLSRRREKLKLWHKESINDDDVLFRHDVASARWMENIYAAEHLRHQRSQQDLQDNFAFLVSTFAKMDRDLHRPCGVFDSFSSTKWKLDRTEGRNRMRLRMLPDREALTYDYQPKRKATDPLLNGSSRVDTKSALSPTRSTPASASLDARSSTPNSQPNPKDNGSKESLIQEEDFELVDNPDDAGDRGSSTPNAADDAEDNFEDKNRKVMRSIQQGDKVQAVYNISRVIGLEACEGLLILGKDALYIMDNLFVRLDGEIVNVSQAPIDQRDPYLQMIAGQTNVDKKSQPVRNEQETRHWIWNDVLSISKRRFLFRDVALEVFFTDGRSYLLTTIDPLLRDELYSKLTSKAPHTTGNSSLPNPEDGWRLEALKVAEEAPMSGFGSKFSSIFNASAWNPAMRRWAKGEISNFHYLMLVNTMAGRTFNDLTQYPVFPWVLADYTSEELDLNNPATFRDLSKPMGAQHISRQADFIERYKSFAEMGDHNAPPFHYGTHYSSAMIVTSYLIRLQPFVQSYLLLQGGNFDHPDRLFYSIEKAWTSASRDNMTDVRELIPEFFYLPEFLTNNNGYNFGLRQGSGGSIDNIVLPRWAKGDPKIFIAKHREALESPYVSKHLHSWIDLIFGSKQRGEAALENTNVFHHLSYHGARDLDTITDPVERLATIGIIHNFGQTPHQVFSKPHQAREEMRHKFKRLDTAAESLTRLPFPLLETNERVTSLVYSPKLDRLLSATAFKLNFPPYYDKFMEWGFSDCSVRFYFCDSKKQAGLFENLHQGQLSATLFASSQILITAGEDCTVSAHTVVTQAGKPVELQPRASLFGHRTPVNVLAVSKSFSTLLSASSDGLVLLWDLNRLELVRKLTYGRQVECALINDITGTIMLCRGQRVSLYTLNGELILDQHICHDHDDYIYSCAFYEGTGNEWLESELIFTGHRRGVVNVWRKTVATPIKGRKLSNAGTGGKWELELVKRLDHIDTKRSQEEGGSGNSVAAITCIRPMAQAVYTGDEDGRVYEWDLVQRER